MIRIDKKDFEQSASEYLDKVQAGETIVIADGGAAPIAEVHPVIGQPRTVRQRRLGFAKGMIKMKSSFFDPMTDEELKQWYGA